MKPLKPVLLAAALLFTALPALLSTPGCAQKAEAKTVEVTYYYLPT